MEITRGCQRSTRTAVKQCPLGNADHCTLEPRAAVLGSTQAPPPSEEQYWQVMAVGEWWEIQLSSVVGS